MNYKIVVDCMGFENKPEEAIKAALEYSKKNPDVFFILSGDMDLISPHIENNINFTCLSTSQIITMDDNPLSARKKTESSMYKAIELVANDGADAVISAGSSGAYVGLTYSMFGKVSEKIKPGFMSWVPTTKNNGFYFLDVGANKEFTGEELYYLGLMAQKFITGTTNKKNPRIGLLNIGVEENKGFSFHSEANVLFKNNNDNLNYLGFVEPRELIEGICDILVADGYSGNLVLKSLEGALKSVSKILKTSYKRNILAAIFSIGIIKKIYKTFNYKNNAGAIVLGLNKLALKTHGSADKKQFLSTIRMAHEALKSNLISVIKTTTNQKH